MAKKDRLLPKDKYRELHGTRAEPVDADPEVTVKHVGGGVFELPNGERVKGREAAESRMDELAKSVDGPTGEGESG